jgi:hypothetical protein
MLRLRWMLGLFILVLALSLAACGGGGEEEETGGGEKETPAATKTVEAEETQAPAETPEPEKTEEPSGGGGGTASLKDIPIYPGADKVGDYSGSDVPLPLVTGDLDVEDYTDAKWAVYETDDSVDDVADFYKGKMPDNGWHEENWFDTSVLGGGAAWGSYTRDGGDTAAWVFVGGGDDRTEIVIGTGTK